MRHLFRTLTALALIWFGVSLEPPVNAYSGEDLLHGRPWHHENITCRALVGDAKCIRNLPKQDIVYNDNLGFSENAAHAIAWHADYIDSYMYSPLWWGAAIRGGKPVRSIRNRYLAGMANYWQLASLHFDDLNSAREIEESWQRYLSGTLVALEWAAKRKMPDGSIGDTQAAYNILGVGLHANQDFYSHSTWINDASRRKSTYLDVPTNVRKNILATGAYEQKFSPVQHGKYSFSCSAYTVQPLKGLMSLVCANIIPTANLGFCEEYRKCYQDRRQSTHIQLANGPIDFIVLSPPGIAMDNTWLSQIGAEQRGLIQDMSIVTKTLARPVGVTRNQKSAAGNKKSTTGQPNVTNHKIRPRQIGRVQETRIRGTENIKATTGLGGNIKKLSRQALGVPKSIPFRQLREAEKTNAREVCSQIIGHGKPCERESDFLFAEGKHLAVISSKQWIRQIQAYMIRKHPVFWSNIKNCRTNCAGKFNFKNPPRTVTSQFENYQSFPFQFLSAGHDKPVSRTDEDGWYMRIELDTGNERGSGTSADIKVIGDESRGEIFLLDYLSMSNPHSPVRGLLTYDDLEKGDKQVYTVGPFHRLPNNLELYNDASSGKERRRALRRQMKRKIVGAFEGARHFFRNDQDYVGLAHWTPTREELEQIIRLGETLSVRGRDVTTPPGTKYLIIDGDKEGVYQFEFKISKTSWQGQGEQRGWAEYNIYIDRIRVLKESSIDGATRSDEPFFFAGINAYGLQAPEFQRYGPFENIGTSRRDRKTIEDDRRFRNIRLPRFGGLMISLEAFESDKEKSRDRDALYTRFQGAIAQEDSEEYRQFISELGRGIGGDWKLAGVRVYGFRRGNRPEFGKMLDIKPNIWIDEEVRKTFTLDKNAVKSLGVDLTDHNVKPY